MAGGGKNSPVFLYGDRGLAHGVLDVYHICVLIFFFPSWGWDGFMDGVKELSNVDRSIFKIYSEMGCKYVLHLVSLRMVVLTTWGEHDNE